MQQATDRYKNQITVLIAAAFCLLATMSQAALQAESQPPPRNIPLEEIDWDKIEIKNISKYGERALEVDRRKWRHAETDNFVLHFRRVTEAKKVAREIEFVLWFAAKLLHATPDDYQNKSHVFIFEDEQEWVEFVADTGLPKWSNSVAVGDELFLNVRYSGNSRRFDSNTLAHETAHAAVARIFKAKRWPLWLNEGFAEFTAVAGVAERKNQTLGRHLYPLKNAKFTLDELMNSDFYPKSTNEISQFYQSSERVVRFMMMELPDDRFREFVDALLVANNIEKAVIDVYGDKFEDYSEFSEALAKFDG